jgi:hypothetical protein
MAKQSDVLKQFVSLHRQLIQEREEVCNRLAALNKALGSDGTPALGSALSMPPSRDLGMREAIQQATSKEPLGVREIVAAIQQLGFRFKSKNPYNSVGAYLYGKEGRKYFTKSDGRFSPLASSAPRERKSGDKAKRALSPAGRRAIAEAARKRWAKYKSAKSKP